MYEVHKYKKVNRRYLIDRTTDADKVNSKLEEWKKRGDNDFNVYLEKPDANSYTLYYNIYTSRECNEDTIVSSFTSISDADKYINSKHDPENYWVIEKKFSDCNIL